MCIIAGSWGNWLVNQDPKMAEMLLRSCQEGMSEINMSIKQKVKSESTRGTGKKCHFQRSKFLKNAKFTLPFHMIYGKKRTRFVVYLLFGLLLSDTVTFKML